MQVSNVIAIKYILFDDVKKEWIAIYHVHVVILFGDIECHFDIPQQHRAFNMLLDSK